MKSLEPNVRALPDPLECDGKYLIVPLKTHVKHPAWNIQEQVTFERQFWKMSDTIFCQWTPTKHELLYFQPPDCDCDDCKKEHGKAHGRSKTEVLWSAEELQNGK